ncbi:MAG: arginine--tRNA ligase [Chitinophagales bacterium]|nr:arginine--tRNA ligase [Chitinophagales bacterium]
MAQGIETILREACQEAVQTLYGQALDSNLLQVSPTSKEHDGDYTLVVFPLLKVSRKSPEATAQDIGGYLQEHLELVTGYNVIKGFLNLKIADSFWLHFLEEEGKNPQYGRGEKKDIKIALEYCGPNTNKPLHLGHIRNMLLGYSLSNILEFDGNEVIKVNIYNDRGIAICKSMVAWQQTGNGETPHSSGMKGDHLVGKYYVEFDKIYKKQIAELVAQGQSQEEAEKKAPIMQEAQEMLRKWEAGDTETLQLWQQMNDWVYMGFFETYEKLGVNFDYNYYESKTYLLGRDMVLEGLEKGVYFKKEDGSIWVDLTDKGLDQKVLLRSDGTSVYLTQDLGTAQLRYDDFHMDRSVYVVANEQDYHFKVLKLTLEKLGKVYADGIYHLSYGMVELPHGRMKSREGTVVDADDLIEEVIQTAENETRKLGKIDGFDLDSAKELFRIIGLGAIKFFMLRVDPKKKMLFNPEESVDLHGQTAPFVQYTHARIKSMLAKATGAFAVDETYTLNADEKSVLLNLYQYPNIVHDAAQEMNPSLIAMYAYNLAKEYNKFYQEHPVLKADTEAAMQFRLSLSAFVANVIQSSMRLLGIQVPDRM